MRSRAGRAFSVIGALALMQMVAIGSVAAATPCTTGGSGYTVTLCIDAPADGATVTGAVPVTINVVITGSTTSVQRINTYLDGDYLLVDVSSPYTFELPTSTFLDGTHLLEVEATLRNGFKTARASVSLVFANGVTQPPVNTNSFTVRSGTTPAPGAPFVLAATGDGAGGRPEADDVISLIQSWSPNMFAYLGDVYGKGTQTEFFNWYGRDGSRWDALNSITNPIVGNHEYENGVAPGYFDYWDNIRDYYSYDVNGWHVVALNSTSQFGQTQPGSGQYDWLAADLAANQAACTIAYFHHPVVSMGPQGDTPSLNAIWQLLVDQGVDIVLTAHDHQYQRFTPLDRNLVAAAGGTTQFVVGNGGHGIQALTSTGDPRLVAWADSSADSFGALKLDLNASGASFAFQKTNGQIADSGVIPCVGGGADTTPPTDPTQVAAVALSHHEVALSWSPSSDAVGVAGYTILRDGTALGDRPPQPTSYTDTTAAPDATYVYEVQAFDAAGNRSSLVPVSVTMPSVPESITLTASADAYVSSASPGTNFGSSTVLRVDADPDIRSYARFDISGLFGATVTAATIRVRVNSNSTVGFGVASGADAWTESSLTYTNAPSFGAAQGTSGAVATGVWAEVALPPSLFGGGDGPVTLVLTGTSSTGISFASSETATAPQLVLSLSGSVMPDTELPSIPGGLVASGLTTSSVTINWAASTDNFGVTGYRITRNGATITTVGATTTTFTDTALVPDTDYGYQIFAFDAAANESSGSTPLTIRTLPPTSTVTVVPTDDASIRESKPTINYGLQTGLVLDSPPQEILLKFPLNGITAGNVQSAKLRLYNTNSSTEGGRFYRAAATNWSQQTVTWSTAPAISGSLIGSIGSVASGQWYELDVTTAVKDAATEGGALALRTNGFGTTNGATYASLEAGTTTAPQLIIVTS